MSRLIEPAAPSGAPALNGRACADLGVRLAHARSSRGLTVALVAERLLLSTRQVRALEAFDLSAFHNPRFYATALKKYAGFVAVDPELVERAVASEHGPSDPTPVVVPRHEAPAAAPAVRGLDVADAEPRMPLAKVALAVIVILGIGVAGYFAWQRPRTEAAAVGRVTDVRPAESAVPPPAPPAAPSETSPVRDLVTAPTQLAATVETGAAPAATAEHAPASALQPAPLALPKAGPSGTYGAVRVAKPMWVFLRYADGRVVERNLREGDVVTFDAAPVYLALGSTDVELTLADRPIDVTPFIVNGQVRMRATDLALDTGR